LGVTEDQVAKPPSTGFIVAFLSEDHPIFGANVDMNVIPNDQWLWLSLGKIIFFRGYNGDL
jgi:hypothetical protein